jgi:hypothetical protein
MLEGLRENVGGKVVGGREYSIHILLYKIFPSSQLITWFCSAVFTEVKRGVGGTFVQKVFLGSGLPPVMEGFAPPFSYFIHHAKINRIINFT